MHMRSIRFARGVTEPPSAWRSVGEPGTPAGLLEEISAIAGDAVWFADMTRAEHGVPVTKAICAGLAHFKRRRGCERLMKLPKQHSWKATFKSKGRREAPLLVV
jgi:hypothetical protein